MIEATYFDGETTRRHAVQLVVKKRIVAIRGENFQRAERLSKMIVSEPLDHAPRLLRFPDRGVIEVDGRQGQRTLDRMLAENRYKESGVVVWQRAWPLSVLALVTVLAILIAAYQWGLPVLADRVAQHLPTTLEQKIGDTELGMMDKRGILKPSELPMEERTRIRQLFSGQLQPRGDHTVYRLEFRKSGIGPNAFALPNGVIVMTDDLLTMAKDDNAVLGVLSHELGHLKRRHSLRHLLQALGVGAALNMWVGDVSSVLAGVPTLMLDRKYSRDFEREADQYAIDMMHANHRPLTPMADLLEAMSDRHEQEKRAMAARIAAATQDEDDEEDEGNQAPSRRAPPPRQGPVSRTIEPPDYLSTHPSDEERVRKLRAADR